eukprot:5662647-Karenia_brevis.AAC.1
MIKLTCDYGSIMRNICKLDVENGEESKREDKDWVLREIRDPDSGLLRINERLEAAGCEGHDQLALTSATLGGDAIAKAQMPPTVTLDEDMASKRIALESGYWSLLMAAW